MTTQNALIKAQDVPAPLLRSYRNSEFLRGFTLAAQPGSYAGNSGEGHDLVVSALPYKGTIVGAEVVNYARPPQLPVYLRDVFRALRDGQVPAQLVRVRRRSMPLRADGRHMHHYLVPAELRVPVSGMTL